MGESKSCDFFGDFLLAGRNGLVVVFFALVGLLVVEDFFLISERNKATGNRYLTITISVPGKHIDLRCSSSSNYYNL